MRMLQHLRMPPNDGEQYVAAVLVGGTQQRTPEQHKWICARTREGKTRQRAQNAYEQQATFGQTIHQCHAAFSFAYKHQCPCAREHLQAFRIGSQRERHARWARLGPTFETCQRGTSKLLSWVAMLRVLYDKPCPAQRWQRHWLAADKQFPERFSLVLKFSGLGRRPPLLVFLAFSNLCRPP